MLLAALGLSAPAFAQQEAGAGQLEFGVATGGGVLLIDGGEGVSKFGNFAVGATVTFNVNDRVGLEGDLGMAMGRNQDLTIDEITLVNQKTPQMVNYNGALIYSPLGIHRRLYPYIAGGVGGLTLRNAPNTDVLGLTTSRTFFTGSTGGGMNWFPIRHLGVRGDYRLLIIRNGSDAPALLGTGAASLGHRIYGALILTY
jgi:outer membrane protein with beta-barrel domain